jgi:hypothetical protein
VPLCYPDFIKVEYPCLLRDVGSVSHAIFGKFINISGQQLAILRGSDTIEIYTVTEKLQLVTKYHMPNAKCIDMVAAKLPFRGETDKQVLLVHLPKLKVVLLEFSEEVSELQTLCIFNFENEEQFRVSGKRFPLTGLLRSVSTHWFSGFGFMADDTVFSWVQFQEN